MIPEKPEFIYKRELSEELFDELMRIFQDDIDTLEGMSFGYVTFTGFQRLPELLHEDDYKNMRKKLKALLIISKNLYDLIDNYLAKINSTETYTDKKELVDGMKKCKVE
jgi:hypothetical protein